MTEFFRIERVRLATNWMRLVLMPVACIAAWFAAVIIGLILQDVAEMFCPADQMVSGCCVAPWWRPTEKIIFCFSVGLSAVLVVMTAFFVTPIARVEITWLAFFIGAIIATWVGIQIQQLAEPFSALSSGLLTTVLLTHSRFATPADTLP